jgi:hypothetical protein
MSRCSAWIHGLLRGLLAALFLLAFLPVSVMADGGPIVERDLFDRLADGPADGGG